MSVISPVVTFGHHHPLVAKQSNPGSFVVSEQIYKFGKENESVPQMSSKIMAPDIDMVTQLLETHCWHGEALVLLADPQLNGLGPSENNWP